MGEALRFLADMNLSPLTVADLQAAGWDVVRVSSFLPATASDRDVLAFARDQGRVVITQDLDFSALLALSGQAQPSLITLRLSNTDPSRVTQRLLEIAPAVGEALRLGCAVSADDETVRIRRLPMASGPPKAITQCVR